jgi:hypothetical protein
MDRIHGKNGETFEKSNEIEKNNPPGGDWRNE